MKEEGTLSLGKWRNSKLYFLDHEKKLIIEDKFVKHTNFDSMPKRKKDVGVGSDEFETLKLKKRFE